MFTGKKKTIWIIKIVTAVFLLTVLVKTIHYREIKSALIGADFRWMILALLLLMPNIYFQFKKWQILVRLIRPNTANVSILSSLFSGITLGFITPGRVGEFARAFFIPGTTWTQLIGFVMVDKIFSLAVLYIVGILGIWPILQLHLHTIARTPIIVTISAVLLFAYFILFNPKYAKPLLKWFITRYQNHEKILQFFHSFENLSSRINAAIFTFALFQVSTYLFQFYLFLRAFVDVPVLDGILAVGATMWAKTLLPISIGDLGVRESAAVFFLGRLGVSSAVAFNASLLLFALNILVPTIIGFYIIIKSKFNRNSA